LATPPDGALSNREYAPGRGRSKHGHVERVGAAVTLESWPDDAPAAALGEAGGAPGRVVQIVAAAGADRMS